MPTEEGAQFLNVVRPQANLVFEWGSEYLNRGIAVIPVPFRSKAPIISGWQNLSITTADADGYFNGNPTNIGALLGERSGWLVDIDLDSPEAIMLADYFLPATQLVFGRKSKKASHRLYVCQDAGYTKYNDPLMLASSDEGDRKNACIVEIRTGKGKQTIFPPSVHVGGEAIEWARYGHPVVVSASELRAAVGRLAAASLLVKFWRKGVQHEMALAVSGILLRHEFDKASTMHFIESVCLAAGDDELSDRMAVVDSTGKAIEAGEPVTGIPRLIELTDRKIVDSMCKWLGITHRNGPAASGIPSSGSPNGVKQRSRHEATLFNETLNIEVVPNGRKHKVTVRNKDSVIAIDTFNLVESTKRIKFIESLPFGFDDDQKSEILRALLNLTDELQNGRSAVSEAPALVRISFKELSDGRIIEQISSGFAVYNPANGEFSVEHTVLEPGGTIYEPVDDELLKKDGGIYLADDLEEYGTEEDLDAEIERYIAENLDLRPLQLKLTAKYIRFTYIFDRSLELSYLNPTGDMGSGKSRYGLTTCIASRRGLCLINPSAASLFRIIDQYHPTLFIDEANFAAHTDDTSAIIQVLNAGFQVTARIPRQKATADGGFTTEMFDPYCPKIIGSLKKSASTALNSRCIEIAMEATKRNDIPLRLTSNLLRHAAKLRNMLTLWRLRNLSCDFESRFEKAERELRATILSPRTIQISIPLFALIDDPGVKEDFINLLTRRDSVLQEEKRSTFDGGLIQAIHTILFETNENGTCIWQIDRPAEGETCEDLRIEKIASMLNGERSGRDEIKASYLGKRIIDLGLSSKQILRRGSDYRKKTAIVLDTNRLKTLFQNYGLPLPEEFSLGQSDHEVKLNIHNGLPWSEHAPQAPPIQFCSDQSNSNDVNNNGNRSEWSEHNSAEPPSIDTDAPSPEGESEDEKLTREEREAIRTENIQV